MSSFAAAPRRSSPWYVSLIADPTRAVRTGVTLILAVAMAWSLGAHDFGVLQAALALATLLSAATSLGLDASIREQLRNQPYVTDAALGTGMAMRCGLGVIVYVALLSLTSSTQSTPQSVWLVSGLMLLTQTPLLLGLRLEEAGYRDRAQFSRNVGFAISAVLVLAMVRRGADTVWFACAVVLEQPLVGLLLLLGHGKVAPEEEAFTWDWNLARTWLRRCRSTWFAALLPYLTVSVSLLVLMVQSSPGQVGRFGLAALLLEVAVFCATAILAEYLVNRVSIDAADTTAAEKETNEVFNRAALIGWSCFAGVALLSTLLGLTFLRQSFSALPIIGSIAGLSLVPYALGLARDAQTEVPLRAKRRTRTQVVIAAVNLVAAIILGSLYGATGAAVSLVIAGVGGELIAPFFFASERKLARSQGKSLIVWSLWHGKKIPSPSPAPEMTPEPLPTPETQEEPTAPLHIRLARSADSIDAVPTAGAIAKSS